MIVLQGDAKMATEAEVTALDMKLTAVQTDLKADISRLENKVDALGVALNSKMDVLGAQVVEILVILRKTES